MSTKFGRHPPTRLRVILRTDGHTHTGSQYLLGRYRGAQVKTAELESNTGLRYCKIRLQFFQHALTTGRSVDKNKKKFLTRLDNFYIVGAKKLLEKINPHNLCLIVSSQASKSYNRTGTHLHLTSWSTISSDTIP